MHKAGVTEKGTVAERVAYGLMRGVVRFAARQSFSLVSLRRLLEVAYFQQLRSDGRTVAEVADALGVSPRKAGQLSSAAKQNFMPAHAEVSLARRIEFLLWAEPLSRARLHQLLNDEEPSDVDKAIETLLREERVSSRERGRGEVLQRTKRNSRLVDPGVEQQLDGLSNLMDGVAGAAFAGFFRDEPKAMIRTINFYLRAEDAEELRALYRQVWERVVELEKRAADDPNAVPMDLSVLFAPSNYLDEVEKKEE